MRYFLNTLLSSICFLSFYGCVSTTPNISILDEKYSGKNTEPFSSVTITLKTLFKENNLLARELGKLPDLQDGITVEEKQGTDLLLTLYMENQAAFGQMFQQMYRVGLPEKRKYCTPLQALFWLSKKKKIPSIKNQINVYSTQNLLNDTWKLGSLPEYITDQQMRLLIENIQIASEKAQYIDMWNKKKYETFAQTLYWDHKRDSKKSRENRIFTKNAKKIIKEILNAKKEDPNWSDYRKTVIRLNSPELVDYYSKNRLKWVDWRSLPTKTVSNLYVFKNGVGDCTAISNFIAGCLRAGGYNAYEFKVAPLRSVDNHHSIVVFKDKGKTYVIDNGTSFPRGIIRYEKYMDN